MHTWALGLSCETPGSLTTARELQTCTFQGPGASNTTKIPRKDPKRVKEERKLWRRREKARNFGPSTFRGSTLQGPTLLALLGPTLLGPTLLGPTLLGSTLRGHPSGPNFFKVWGLHPSRAPHFVVPKFNIQKLAEIELPEVEIGRSRNWPKSKKRAEVEIGRSRSPPLAR